MCRSCVASLITFFHLSWSCGDPSYSFGCLGPSVSVQQVFFESCATCRYIFDVVVGGSEIHFLFCHLNWMSDGHPILSVQKEVSYAFFQIEAYMPTMGGTPASQMFISLERPPAQCWSAISQPQPAQEAISLKVLLYHTYLYLLGEHSLCHVVCPELIPPPSFFFCPHQILLEASGFLLLCL